MEKNMNKLKDYLKNKMSFATRLFISFFSISIPLMLIISCFLYVFLEKSSRENIAQMMLQVIERTKSQVEYIFSETEYLSRNIIYDEDVQRMLKEADAGNPYPAEEDVKYFINSFIVNREYMDSVVLVGNEDVLFSTEKATTAIGSMENIRMKWWYDALDDGEMPFQWFTAARTDSVQNDDSNVLKNDDNDALKYDRNVVESYELYRENNDTSLMLTRVIRSTSDYKTQLGRMMIYISEDYIEKIWSSIQWGDTLNVWLFDENNEIICQNFEDSDYLRCVRNIYNLAGNEKTYSDVIKYAGVSYVVGMERFDNHDWTIVMAVPLSEVNENSNMIWIQIAIMVLMTLVMIVCTALIVSSNISRPVRWISEIMDSYHDHSEHSPAAEEAKQQRIIKTFEGRDDEIGKIYRSYNQMVGRVDHMIKEIYLKDLEKKDAELALMQSQINPHFLYNTLDSINWLAMMNEQDEISEMVTALSDTFRLSLRRSNSPYVKIEQEMEYIESYMTLQKIRFGDKLTFEVHMDASIKKLFMLRFVLQPIIENAIKHGIRNIEDGGKIEVYFKIENNNMLVDVINDGADIDLEQMQQILKFDMETDTFLSFNNKGYGLQNINRRIKIVHGVLYGLHYEIIDGSRTLCQVTLPVIEKDISPDEYTNKCATEMKEDADEK